MPENGQSQHPPRVVTVVLNWHGRDDTLECLRALAMVSYRPHSVVLLDNGCTQFSAAEITGILPDAEYIHVDENLGFAGGANLGMRHALASGAAFIWFVNNDARPEPDALTELVAVAQREPPAAIVGAKILQLQNPRRLDSIALDVDLRSGRLYLKGHNELDEGQYDDVGEVSAVTACAMLVSRAACERLDGFDAQFFAYLEDADLCLRARAVGFRIAAAPRARVLHNRVAATGARQTTASLYLTARNHLLLMQRHGEGGLTVRLMRPPIVATLSLAYALRGAARERPARLRAVLRGLRDYRRGVRGEGSAFSDEAG